MDKDMKEKETFDYESFIVGALLKFKVLDNIDISLLIDDFKKKTNIEISGLWYETHYDLDKYIECLKNGTYKFKDGITLDYYIEEENCTLRDKFYNIAGNIISSYFDGLDLEKYKKEKSKFLLKNELLDTANILLISDVQDDYDELIKYGFKNVDYFKSIIRADKYFSEHPEELDKYHIIIKGKQNVQRCSFYGSVELDERLSKLRNKESQLVFYLYRTDYPDHINLVTSFVDLKNYRQWIIEEHSYKDIIDEIADSALVNHVLERFQLKDKKFVPIKDYVNPNRLTLPKRKTDLKILFLRFFFFFFFIY